MAGSEIAEVAAVDPVRSFCQRFDAFAQFSDQDREPTPELIAELLRLQADVDPVVPSELEGDWEALNGWFQPILDVLERDGYGPVTEEVLVAAFGDMDAFGEASERTEAAYQAIYDWQDINCPIGESDQAFCDQWRPYEQLINSDPDVDAELVAEVVTMEEGLQAVVPEVLEADLSVSVDWNARFIEWYESNEYAPATDEAIFDVLGDEAEAVEASQAREAAFESIESWIDANCGQSGTDASFCDQWTPYAEFIESVEEPTEELVARLLDYEAGIEPVVPPELSEAWRGVVDWNTPFLELLDRIGYQPITDEIFLQAFEGDQEAADAAGEAREAGYGAIQVWVDANCTGDTVEGSSTLPVQFCSAWNEFAALTADDAELDAGQFEQLREIVGRANADVPAAVADDWAALTDFVDRYGDVLVSVEFREERITDDMLAQAFGSVEAYDDAVAAREAAAGAIVAWSLEGCGGFCGRWPDTREALDHFVGDDLGWVVDSGDEGAGRLEELKARLTPAGQLVDAAIRADWDHLNAAIDDWLAVWSSIEFDRDRFDTQTVDGLRMLIADSSYVDGIVETMRDHHLGEAALPWEEAQDWLAGSREAPEWLSERVGDPEQWLREAILRGGPQWWLPGQHSRVTEWADANCAASTGGPGTFRVRWPRVEGRAGGTVVMALLPLGGTYDDLADVPSTLAAYCEGVSRDPWGVWIEEHPDDDGEPMLVEFPQESEPFRDERWSEDQLCGFHHEESPPTIDAGPYTLVGGIMWGSPGDPAEGLDLVSCLEMDVVIDSDTIVELPPFEPCDVRIGGGDPDPWRNPPPVDPSTPGAGTLKVRIPEFVLREGVGGRDGGELQVVVLPAGATLNEVGRQQLWPSAGSATWVPPSGSEHAEDLARRGAVMVPLAPLPPSGRPVNLEPDWLAGNPTDDELPLAVLAPGAYDVRFELRWHVADGDEVPPEAYVRWGEASLCAQTEVVIDGDTVVEMPEFGECP